LFYRRVLGRFGKLPKLYRFVPKIISPIHATRNDFKGSDSRPRQAAFDSSLAPEQYYIAYRPLRLLSTSGA
jgi:hypothetical protein